MGEVEAARQNYLWGVWCVHAFQIKKMQFSVPYSNFDSTFDAIHVHKTGHCLSLEGTLTNNNPLHYKFQKCICLYNNE